MDIELDARKREVVCRLLARLTTPRRGRHPPLKRVKIDRIHQT